LNISKQQIQNQQIAASQQQTAKPSISRKSTATVKSDQQKQTSKNQQIAKQGYRALGPECPSDLTGATHHEL
jgi:hypothetical protein